MVEYLPRSKMLSSTPNKKNNDQNCKTEARLEMTAQHKSPSPSSIVVGSICACARTCPCGVYVLFVWMHVRVCAPVHGGQRSTVSMCLSYILFFKYGLLLDLEPINSARLRRSTRLGLLNARVVDAHSLGGASSAGTGLSRCLLPFVGSVSELQNKCCTRWTVDFLTGPISAVMEWSITKRQPCLTNQVLKIRKQATQATHENM